MTFALYLHAPAHASDKPSYTIDSPAIVAWWNAENIVGGSCLIPVHDLAAILESEKSDSVKHIVAVLWVMEEASVVRVDRRE